MGGGQFTHMKKREVFGNVFISSTYNDLLKYRGLVIQAVEKQYFRPIDPHRASYGNEETCQFLERQIGESQYASVVVGFRYGSRIAVNEPETLSYTEFEFHTATDRLVRPGKWPIYVIVPAEGSKFAEDVRREAENFDNDVYKGDEARIEADKSALECFRQRIQHKFGELAVASVDVGPETLASRTFNRLYHEVESDAHLFDRVNSLLYGVKDEQFRDQPAAEVENPAGKPEETAAPKHPDWDTTLAAIDKRFDEWQRLQKRPNPAPALCLVIAGSDREQTTALNAELLARNPWKHWDVEETDNFYRFPKPDLRDEGPGGRPVNGINTLYRQSYGFLNDNLGEEDFNPEALADSILSGDPAYMMSFCQIGHMEGSLKAFITEFWQPLYDQLVR